MAARRLPRSLGRMQFALRTVVEADASSASELVHLSFSTIAANDWEPSAAAVFLAESVPDGLRQRIASSTYVCGAFSSNTIVGLVLMPSPTLLGMLFVHPERLRNGVGRGLWESARAHIEAHFPATQTVELNATPNSLPFYSTVGFVPISAEHVYKGCRTTRMACWLPARKLGCTVP